MISVVVTAGLVEYIVVDYFSLLSSHILFRHCRAFVQNHLHLSTYRLLAIGVDNLYGFVFQHSHQGYEVPHSQVFVDIVASYSGY